MTAYQAGRISKGSVNASQNFSLDEVKSEIVRFQGSFFERLEERLLLISLP